MSIRFQADANLNPEIGNGLRRREPAIDFRNALGVIADGTLDPEVLRMAARGYHRGAPIHLAQLERRRTSQSTSLAPASLIAPSPLPQLNKESELHLAEGFFELTAGFIDFGLGADTKTLIDVIP